MSKNNQLMKTFKLIKTFFDSRKIDFWLEAGTALAAYRDGKIFPWEHDIDIAIWRDSLPCLEELKAHFSSRGFEIIIQKSFPYLDNIIQLKVSDSISEEMYDIDIYLYSRLDGFAYMRWIQKPEGAGAGFRKKILFALRNLLNPPNERWTRRSNMFPSFLVENIFKLYLKLHICLSSCIYHKFPEHFFLNLKNISFYGVRIKIPADTEEFLTHRYGSGWRTPDSTFNQSGKWRMSGARVRLPMSLLPHPKFDKSLLKLPQT